jgi:hypothetical protein
MVLLPCANFPILDFEEIGTPCSECATAYNRDIDAAINILAAGHGRLAGGIPSLPRERQPFRAEGGEDGNGLVSLYGLR